jgi:hypothetical protein
MLFSTSSAIAFSGLLCDRAMIRIAFQSSPIRSLPFASAARAIQSVRFCVGLELHSGIGTEKSRHLCSQTEYTTINPFSKKSTRVSKAALPIRRNEFSLNGVRKRVRRRGPRIYEVSCSLPFPRKLLVDLTGLSLMNDKDVIIHEGTPRVGRDYPVRRTPRSGDRHRQAAGVVLPEPKVSERFWEFLTSNIRNRLQLSGFGRSSRTEQVIARRLLGVRPHSTAFSKTK